MLEAAGLTKIYRSGILRWDKTVAVEDISFTITKGQCYGLIGESGSGKSTVGRLVAGLTLPSSGSVLMNGRNISGMGAADRKIHRSKVQMIFQEPDGSLDPRWKTSRSLAEPFRLHQLLPEGKITGRVKELLNIIGLHSEHLNRYPFELSGGQLQRISLARALALETELIVADEPTSSLDVSVQAQILCLLKELQQKLNLAILFITHDLYVARQMCQRVAVMYRGTVVEEGDTEFVLAQPAHPYTRLLLESLLIPDPDARKNRVGTMRRFNGTELEHTYKDRRGCLFYHRCKMKNSLCEQVKPDFVFITKGHKVACHHAEPFSAAPKIAVI
ncbi:peptide/nickel transport system ATP-binding protein [Desulfotomaculum arcticum]|uniref:Peptide/nickel transport system ATP-binding protein n=1 Tax=Desulfotruncus arcticus DSM 17038 TaxID=1121424 RepID=A0A1I2XQV4_9FIRM|nr:ABC transporter ATP-binding protein [Desulfotruncus arcticus]SFH15449.1 peptide/nickel transport system ATP-binding protein [Desulfotomaculum arcticum] [Desulfotruncus arcticus DSM 17038]